MYLIYACYAGPVGCTESQVDDTTKQIFCHCATSGCDAHIDGPKYDAGILTPVSLQEGKDEAPSRSGSARAPSMTVAAVVMVMLAADLCVRWGGC